MADPSNIGYGHIGTDKEHVVNYNSGIFHIYITVFACFVFVVKFCNHNSLLLTDIPVIQTLPDIISIY